MSSRIAHGLEAGELRAVTGHPVYILPLGYEKPPLSLNDRHGWKREARIKREIRIRVSQRLRSVLGAPSRSFPHVHVLLHYVPKQNRTRDADNLIATLKPCLDALTAAGKPGLAQTPLVPDDSPEYVTWSPPVIHPPDQYGPRVYLEIRTGPAPR